MLNNWHDRSLLVECGELCDGDPAIRKIRLLVQHVHRHTWCKMITYINIIQEYVCDARERGGLGREHHTY